MYDVSIIGAGIVGTSIARELSKYKLKTIIIEKDNDVANGTTKANSAIVHSGYDAKPGTNKARTNVKGNLLYPKLCEELAVPFKKIGSFVAAFNDEQVEVLKELLNQGGINGVPDLQILSKEQILKMEPNISEDIIAALYAPTAGIVGAWELAIALAENAAQNGVELLLNSPVTAISKEDKGYKVIAGERVIETRYIINCAGLYADKINDMVNEPYFKILPNRGEYNLFDKSVGSYINKVLFQTPSKEGKGVVALPTVHGNFLIGPTSEWIERPEDVQTTSEGLKGLRQKGEKVLPNFPFNTVITSFSGIRAKVEHEGFIIEEAVANSGFLNVAAIDSPGLTAAPAIALEVVELLQKIAGKLEENHNFNPIRRPNIHFMDLSDTEKAELIKKDTRYGRIICRCEGITEGEIVDIVNRKAGATNLDAVKRRARAGAGRCQGGFCAPRVMEILARELNVDITSIVKDGKKSYILTGLTKSKIATNSKEEAQC